MSRPHAISPYRAAEAATPRREGREAYFRACTVIRDGPYARTICFHFPRKENI